MATRLEAGEVVCHPFVIGELSVGSLKKRDQILGLLFELPMASVVPHEDVLSLVEQARLAGQGIGWVDVHLIASALLGRLRLWTIDRRLALVARALGLSA